MYDFQLFVYHESLARTIDEELDNDLILEDAPEEGEQGDDDEGSRWVFTNFMFALY